MKILDQRLLPSASLDEHQPPRPATGKWMQNPGGWLLPLAAVIVVACSQHASAQVITAGNVVANLQSADLTASSPTWVNRATGAFSVGNFSTIGGGNANVQTVNGYNALYVNTNSNNAMLSLAAVPTSITGNGSFTTEAWVYTTNLYSGFDSHNYVASYGDNSGNHTFRNLGYSPTGNGSDAFGTGNFNDLGYQTNPPQGSWSLVDYTYNSSNNTATVYVNGTVNVTGTFSTLATTSSKIFLGTAFDQSDPFAGYIGAFRVEDGVLSQSDIQNNFAQGVGGMVVPEPASTGAILGGLLGAFALYRVRQQKA